MKSMFRAAIVAMAVTTAAAPAFADPLQFDGLKTMVENMGYTPKIISKGDDNPKFEISISTPAFNVPLGVEISKSGRFIWASASLGESKLTGDGALAVLKKAQDIQPTSLWITSKGILMIGMAIDNREVTPAYLKYVFEKIAADVGATSSLWQAASSTG